MKTLRMLTAGVLMAVAAAAAIAAEERSVPTVTVTAKRHATQSATEGLPPRAAIQIPQMPTDMPEAEIDYHLLPLGAPPAPAGETR
jgi:hypothetical protein